MSLVILDIPNDSADWPAWLERQLVGLDLGDLVGQLPTVLEPTDDQDASPTLAGVCGPQLPEIFHSGLSVLTAAQVRLLLKHPALLLELQEQVLIQGSPYWSNLPLTAEHQQLVANQWRKISAQLDAEQQPDSSPLPMPSSVRPPLRRSSIRWLATVAAIVCVGVGLWFIRPPSVVSWGFERSGLLTANVTASEYLNSLADAVGDWFKQRPQTQAGLEHRLVEFVHGCETLIAAPHPQLSAKDRAWLVERCQVWKSKIEGQLVELKSGDKTVAEVQAEADETVNKLIAALREHSRQAA